MLRKFLISAAVILLLSSVSVADIGQVEGFSIGSLNIVGRCGWIGSAQSENIVVVGQSQQVQKPGFFFNTTAKQQENGMLIQNGSANGTGGLSGVAQRANILGKQGQLTEKFGPTMQGQRLNVNLGQIAIKSVGVGSTEGKQAFIGGQSQMISTPRMTSSESQSVGILQNAVVSGQEESKGIVVNTVNVELGQGQIVTGGLRSPQ